MSNKINIEELTNSSLLKDIELEEAEKVNGGLYNYVPTIPYWFSLYPNKYTYTRPRFSSLSQIDRRVGGILSTLRWL